MKRIKDISKRAPRVRDVGPRGPRVDPSVFAAAIGGQPVGTVPTGLDPAAFAALRREIMTRLVSSGGRPGLDDAARRQKIPLADADWARLVDIAEQMSSQDPRPTPGQIASALLRIVLSRPDLIEPVVAPSNAAAIAGFATHAKDSAAGYRVGRAAPRHVAAVEAAAATYAAQLQLILEYSPSETRSAIEALLETLHASFASWRARIGSRS